MILKQNLKNFFLGNSQNNAEKIMDSMIRVLVGHFSCLFVCFNGILKAFISFFPRRGLIIVPFIVLPTCSSPVPCQMPSVIHLPSDNSPFCLKTQPTDIKPSISSCCQRTTLYLKAAATKKARKICCCMLDDGVFLAHTGLHRWQRFLLKIGRLAQAIWFERKMCWTCAFSMILLQKGWTILFLFMLMRH